MERITDIIDRMAAKPEPTHAAACASRAINERLLALRIQEMEEAWWDRIGTFGQPR